MATTVAMQSEAKKERRKCDENKVNTEYSGKYISATSYGARARLQTFNFDNRERQKKVAEDAAIQCQRNQTKPFPDEMRYDEQHMESVMVGEAELRVEINAGEYVSQNRKAQLKYEFEIAELFLWLYNKLCESGRRGVHKIHFLIRHNDNSTNSHPNHSNRKQIKSVIQQRARERCAQNRHFSPSSLPKSMAAGKSFCIN